jgi:lipopolysaccharide export system permease protein
MKRLHWYVIKSFLGPFFMTFFIVVFILLMQFLWKYVDDLVGKGIEFKLLGEMIFYASFGLLPFAFPLAMLLASIMTFGALGENYELVAMKSSGISLFRVMRPLMVIAVAVMCIAFYFSNNILPYTNLKFTTILLSVKQQRPEMVLQQGVFTGGMDGYSIKVGSKNSETNMFYDMLIYDHTQKRGNISVTVADSGYMRITEDRKYMVLNLYDGVNYEDVTDKAKSRKEKQKRPYRRDKFKEQTIRVRVKGFEFNRKDEGVYKNWYRMMNIKQLAAAEDTLNIDYYKRLRNYMLQLSISPSLTKKTFDLTAQHDSLKRNLEIAPDMIFNFDEYFAGIDKWVKGEIVGVALERARGNMQNLNLYQTQLYERKKLINKHEMERHRKFTLSIAVLIFFFIGAPLGAIIRKGGMGMPVVVSILLFIAYYIVSITGEKSAREEVWQMVTGMWFSSFIFLPIGVWLSYKAATDASVMTTETYVKIFNKLGLSKLIKGKQEKNETNPG